MSSRRFIAAAFMFLVGWAGVFLGPIAESDAVASALLVATSVVAGALAGDWRIAFLALAVIPIAALQGCDPERFACEINAPAYAAIFFAPPAAALLAMGAGLGWIIERGHHRRESL